MSIKYLEPATFLVVLIAFLTFCAHCYNRPPQPKRPPLTINDIIKQGEIDLERHRRMEARHYHDDRTKPLAVRQALAYNYLYELGARP